MTVSAARSSRPSAVSRIRPGDTLSLYLAEVARTDLLTPEAEHRLAVACRAGGDGDEDREARQRAQSEMTVRNLRLVVSIAKQYVRPGILLGDLINEGNIGLIEAAGRYDPDIGVRFSTYATYWIRQAIARSIKNDRSTIRIPVYMWDAMKRMDKGLEVTDTERRYRKFADIAVVVHSLDSPSWDHGGNGSHNVTDGLSGLIDSRNAIPGHDAECLEENARVRRMVDALTEYDARLGMVIALRFGLDGNGSRTLQQVGDAVGLTRERARQLEAEGLKWLRREMRAEG